MVCSIDAESLDTIMMCIRAIAGFVHTSHDLVQSKGPGTEEQSDVELLNLKFTVQRLYMLLKPSKHGLNSMHR